MKNIISLFTVAAVLSGCALNETPVRKQESLNKPSFSINHQEDRVTLIFEKHDLSLSGDQLSKINRFISYYKDMDPAHTDFLLAIIDYPDVEGSKVPVYMKNRQSMLMDIKQILNQHDIDYNTVKEMDLYPDQAYIEASARRAILSTADRDEDITGLEPAMEDLARPYKIALLVRKYDIRASKCPTPGTIDRGMHHSQTVGTGIHIGCSVNSGLIEQVKDKTHIVYGDKTEPTFASEYEVKRLNDFYKGEYSGEENKTGNVVQNF